MRFRNTLAALVVFVPAAALPTNAQSAKPVSGNLRGTGTITLPGANERAVHVVRLKMGSDRTVRLVAEGADVPPVEFSGKWSGPVNNAYRLTLTRALKGVKAVASGQVYLRGPKDVQRIALTGKAQGQDFSLEFLPSKPPVLNFKQLSLTASGTGVLKMPDNTQSKLTQVAMTLEKNGNATIIVDGERSKATFGGKWTRVGNSELIRLTITSGFNNAGGTGKGTITMRSANELENLYFTSKAAEGVVYAVRFTGAQGAPPPGTAAAPSAETNGETTTTTTTTITTGETPEKIPAAPPEGTP
ncbi:MAG: hypothetical protein SFU56_02555 [Capsulimonadales bacterium]|nr:hypothetical protein [Capsulimonadales bacterium]